MISNEQFKNAAVLRKNLFYPGRYLSVTTADRSKEENFAKLKIGTFLVHTEDDLAAAGAQHDYQAIASDDSGLLTFVGCSKAYRAFENQQELKIKNLQTYHVLQTFTLATADHEASIQAARFNYKKMNTKAIARPFSFASHAFSFAKESGHIKNVKLELFRPLFSTYYGGCTINIQSK